MEQRRAVDAAVSHEATSFATLIRSSGSLSKEDQATISRGVGKYVVAVRTDEWPNMREGKGRAQSAYDAMTVVYDAVAQLHPEGGVQEATYRSMVTTTNEAYAARRVRLDRAEQHLPGGLVILMASNANRTERTMAVFANGLIGLTLALALLLDHPFSGQLGIDDHVFGNGALAPFNAEVQAIQAERAAAKP